MVRWKVFEFHKKKKGAHKVLHMKGKVITGHTHPTMFNPFSMNDASVGRFPLSISSTKTPKLYTSVFSVALPLCIYSVNLVNNNSEH